MPTFAPEAHEELTIDGETYVVMPDPESADGLPNEQSGKRGTIYELGRKGDLAERWALKTFNVSYRLNEIARTEQNARVARASDLPGLRASRRTVLTAANSPKLLPRFDDCRGALLMPYIRGYTWGSALQKVTSSNGTGSQFNLNGLEAARGLSRAVVELERRRWAHTDLASGNLLVDIDPARGAVRDVQLIDLEEMYFSDAPRPRDEEINCGTESYRHPSLDGRTGIWTPAADRFALAVLVLEMLAAGHPIGRTLALVDDTKSLFGQNEWDDRDRGGRVRDILVTLRERHPAFCDLFFRALHAPRLEDCPDAATILVSLHAPSRKRVSAPPVGPVWEPIGEDLDATTVDKEWRPIEGVDTPAPPKPAPVADARRSTNRPATPPPPPRPPPRASSNRQDLPAQPTPTPSSARGWWMTAGVVAVGLLGYAVFSGGEAPPRDDIAACGAGRVRCPAGEHARAVCTQGVCGETCLDGFTRCGSRCVDTATDRAHCGACSVACIEGACAQGRCAAAVPTAVATPESAPPPPPPPPPPPVAAEPAATPAPPERVRIRFTNRTGDPLTHLFVRRCGSTDWGSNLLANRMLPYGSSVAITRATGSVQALSGHSYYGGNVTYYESDCRDIAADTTWRISR